MIDPVIAGVSGKTLVTAITRKSDSYMPAGEFRHQEGRNLRRVRKWLVVDGRQTLNHGKRRFRLNDKFGMLGAEMRGDALGVICFVEFPVAKADGKGAHRLRRLRLHQRDDSRGVDATGQKSAKWNIGNHLPADGIAKQALQLVGEFRLRLISEISLTCHRNVMKSPVAARRGFSTRLDVENVCGQQLVNAAINRERGGNAG